VVVTQLAQEFQLIGCQATQALRFFHRAVSCVFARLLLRRHANPIISRASTAQDAIIDRMTGLLGRLLLWIERHERVAMISSRARKMRDNVSLSRKFNAETADRQIRRTIV
jgi:hypothetical protein